MQSSTSFRATDPPASGFRWVILALALTTFTMTYVTRFAWPPLLPVIMPQLDITRSVAMTYMTAFWVGYVITQIPGGILADKFGSRRILAFSLLLQGLTTLCLGLVSNFELGLTTRFLCGLGAGFVYSACLKSVCQWFSPTQRGLAIGIVMCAPSLGVALPNILMPALEAAGSWQGAFKVLGLIIMATAILLFALMKDVPLESQAKGAPRGGVFDGLKFVLKNRNILLVALAGLTALWAQVGFGSIGNDLLVTSFNITLKEAGFVMMVYGLAGLAMPSVSGWLSDRFPLLRQRKMMLIGGHLLMGTTVLLIGLGASLSTTTILAALFGMSVGFCNPMYALLISTNSPPQWVATANGASNAIFQLGAVMAPLVCGFTYGWSGGYTLASWLLAGGAFLGILFVVLTEQNTKTQAE